MNIYGAQQRRRAFDGEELPYRPFVEPRCYGYVDVNTNTNAHGTTGGGNVFNAGSIFGNVSNATTIPSTLGDVSGALDSPSSTPLVLGSSSGFNYGSMPIWLIVGGLLLVVGLIAVLFKFKKP